MAETVQFDLVSPARRLSSVEASEVLLPGAEGDMTVMADHMPLITTLRPGIIKVSGSEGQQEYVVTSGFAEINRESVSVLAERAVPRGDMTREEFQSMVDEANERLAKAQEAAEEPGLVDDAAKLLSDMVAMGDEIGLSAH